MRIEPACSHHGPLLIHPNSLIIFFLFFLLFYWRLILMHVFIKLIRSRCSMSPRSIVWKKKRQQGNEDARAAIVTSTHFNCWERLAVVHSRYRGYFLLSSLALVSLRTLVTAHLAQHTRVTRHFSTELSIVQPAWRIPGEEAPYTTVKYLLNTSHSWV